MREAGSGTAVAMIQSPVAESLGSVTGALYTLKSIAESFAVRASET